MNETEQMPDEEKQLLAYCNCLPNVLEWMYLMDEEDEEVVKPDEATDAKPGVPTDTATEQKNGKRQVAMGDWDEVYPYSLISNRLHTWLQLRAISILHLPRNSSPSQLLKPQMGFKALVPLMRLTSH